MLWCFYASLVYSLLAEATNCLLIAGHLRQLVWSAIVPSKSFLLNHQDVWTRLDIEMKREVQFLLPDVVMIPLSSLRLFLGLISTGK